MIPYSSESKIAGITLTSNFVSVQEYYKIHYEQGVACLYAVFCKDENLGVIKVGYSEKPLSRVTSIANGIPFTPYRIGFCEPDIDGYTRHDEAALHRRLASRRSRGEWFKFDLSDTAQAAEFEQYQLYGFSSAWHVFDFKAVRSAKDKHAAKAYAMHRAKMKKQQGSKSDNAWRSSDAAIRGFWMPKGRAR